MNRSTLPITPRARAWFLALTLLIPCTQALAKVDWQKEVWPFIERSCVDCHKAPYEEGGKTKEPKAELRFDAAWGILKGGENGPVLVPGNPDKSEMYFRVTLPDDDSDFMPTKGEPLSKKEKEILKQWIAEGANFGAWEGSLEGKPAQAEEKDASKREVHVPPPSIYDTLAKGVSAPEEESVDAIAATGARIDPLQRQFPLYRIDYFNVRDKTGDNAIAPLAQLKTNTAQLNLAETNITDAGLKTLEGMTNLVHLDLRRTPIGDAGLAYLQGLQNLRYLNLYGTKVTDKGLPKLSKLKNIKALYLWKTGVTEAGIKKLKTQLPKADITWQ